MAQQIAGIKSDNAGERAVHYEQAMRRADLANADKVHRIETTGAISGDFSFASPTDDRFEPSDLDPDLQDFLEACRQWTAARRR